MIDIEEIKQNIMDWLAITTMFVGLVFILLIGTTLWSYWAKKEESTEKCCSHICIKQTENEKER